MVFKWIETSITTLSYLFIFFIWSLNYTNMVYILCIPFGNCQDTQTLFWIYLVLTYIEILDHFFICFCWSVNCMSQVSRFHNFFLTCPDAVERFIFETSVSTFRYILNCSSYFFILFLLVSNLFESSI